MSNPPGDSRKVSQLRNDVDDIYDMLGGINATLDQHTIQLEVVNRRVNVIDGKLDRVLELLDAR